jgi:hypothetical protein
LHFPLLSPTGQLSWSPEIHYVFSDNSARQHLFVSFSEYAKFRLHPRPPGIETTHFFQSGLLFQELLVHLWAAAEHCRLSWIWNHQKKLRAELYNGVIDALHEGIDALSIGKKFVLPASFTSRPRFMQQNLQNTLALLHKFGGSDLFITFTANPHWKEVEEALLPNQAPCERPDIIARVFQLKFSSLLEEIMWKNVFRNTVGYVYTIEYQKHGLPHAHLIVFLDRLSCLLSPQAVDRYISTEFPDEETQP